MRLININSFECNVQMLVIFKLMQIMYRCQGPVVCIVDGGNGNLNGIAELCYRQLTGNLINKLCVGIDTGNTCKPQWLSI